MRSENDYQRMEKYLYFINEVLMLSGKCLSTELLQAKNIPTQAITKQDLLKLKTKA
jgi:hypothetical protein